MICLIRRALLVLLVVTLALAAMVAYTAPDCRLDTLHGLMSLSLGVVLVPTYAMGFLLWRHEHRRREAAALEPQRTTEAHFDEEPLRFKEQRWKQAFDGAGHAVWDWDIQGGTVDFSASWHELIGYQPGELGNSLSEWETRVHPDDLEETLAQIRAHLDGRAQHYESVHRMRHRDGHWVWILDRGLIFERAADGTPIRMIGTHTDITEFKRMEQDLRESERRFRELNANLARQIEASTVEAHAASAAKSEFLAHMSHEIRTPLNAVLGLTQILAREPLDADQHELVEHIQEAGQSLLALINDILDFSKIEAGQLRLEALPFDLTASLAKIDSLMLLSAQSKGLSLAIETPDAPIGPLLGDALRLDQVLLNLTSNAIKFTERGGIRLRIQTLEADAEQVRLRFEVSDSGIGIEPGMLTQLFQAFAQANGAIARRFGGTGLGLSISKRLVELMGGQIGVESRLGQGSTFWFELPFARAATAAITVAPPALRATSGPRLTGRHFLVVDDSAMNREVVERALGREGARVTLAVDGQQALQTLAACPHGFDAVLMDVRMPVMDGLTATRLIRRELGLTELPIIALTAGVMTEEQAAARAAGVDAILPKPLDLEQLTSQLAARLGEPAPDVTVKPPPASPRSVDDEDATLPDIPGIDRTLAGRSLGNDPVFFQRLLTRFIGEQHDVVERTRNALAQDAREAATQIMHRLRGEAGHLGAVDLMQRAERLELAIEQGVDRGVLEPELETLEQRLMDFIALCGPWVLDAETITAPERHTAATDVQPGPDPERIAELRAALSENNSRARRIFRELEPALKSTLGADRCRTLGTAIRDLRFEAALALLQDLSSPT